MMISTKRSLSILAVALCVANAVSAADMSSGSARRFEGEVLGSPMQSFTAIQTIKGRAAVIDGRTLWFPQPGLRVRLQSIDTCELPQWSFDPRSAPMDRNALKPVPCGPFAKAWLKRLVGKDPVECKVADTSDELTGRCVSRGKDLALGLLRIGWARVQPNQFSDATYVLAQRYAVSARYGIWATYVLDMDEWRSKAIDRTTGRKPIADENLLRERSHEISPPFDDARRQPRRTDR